MVGSKSGSEEKAKRRAERERKSRFMVIDNYTVLRAQVEQDDEEKLGYASTHVQKKVNFSLWLDKIVNTPKTKNKTETKQVSFRRIIVMFAKEHWRDTYVLFSVCLYY